MTRFLPFRWHFPGWDAIRLGMMGTIFVDEGGSIGVLPKFSDHQISQLRKIAGRFPNGVCLVFVGNAVRKVRVLGVRNDGIDGGDDFFPIDAVRVLPADFEDDFKASKGGKSPSGPGEVIDHDAPFALIIVPMRDYPKVTANEP